MSSWCIPIWAIVLLLVTTTRSAAATVDGRWATMSRVADCAADADDRLSVSGHVSHRVPGACVGPANKAMGEEGDAESVISSAAPIVYIVL